MDVLVPGDVLGVAQRGVRFGVSDAVGLQFPGLVPFAQLGDDGLEQRGLHLQPGLDQDLEKFRCERAPIGTDLVGCALGPGVEGGTERGGVVGELGDGPGGHDALDALGGEREVEFQRALDRDGAVEEVLGAEDLGVLGLGELVVDPADLRDVLFQELLALGAHGFAHLHEHAGGVDQLDPAALGSRILEIRCMRNSSEPSETRGRPGPKRPANPAIWCSVSTALRCCFQSTPNGGLERQ